MNLTSGILILGITFLLPVGIIAPEPNRFNFHGLDDQDDIVAAAIAKQQASPVPPADQVKFNTKPSRNWYVSSTMRLSN